MLRTWVAMRLSPTIEVCEALLRGELVDPAQLRPEGLAWAQATGFVSLDTRAIDLFQDQHAAVELEAA